MTTPAIQMYAWRSCPYCHRAEHLLRERGVTEFEKILTDTQPERRAEMIERSGGRTSVPQIFIGGKHIGGYDDLAALDARGDLAPLLAGQGGLRA